MHALLGLQTTSSSSEGMPIARAHEQQMCEDENHSDAARMRSLQ